MSRWEAWSFNALNALVTVTGGLYLWMKYAIRSDDPFAVVNHPWQPGVLAAHVVAAPLLIMLFGVVLRSHVLKKLVSNSRPARRSGWTSLVGFGAMALSGYLLQVVADPLWLRVAVVGHLASSAVFVVGYSTHLLAGRLGKVPARERPADSPAALQP